MTEFRYGFETRLKDVPLVDNPAVAPIADEADRKLRRVIATVAAARPHAT